MFWVKHFAEIRRNKKRDIKIIWGRVDKVLTFMKEIWSDLQWNLITKLDKSSNSLNKKLLNSKELYKNSIIILRTCCKNKS